MDPFNPSLLFLAWLPRILLGVAGFLVGSLIGQQLVGYALPIIKKRPASNNETFAIRVFSSLGFALFCFLMAGPFGLGGPSGKGGGGLAIPNEGMDTSEVAKDNPVKIKDSPGKKSTRLQMRILSPEFAKNYSGESFGTGKLFWFHQDPAIGSELKPKLVDWMGAQELLGKWKEVQPAGSALLVDYLYTRQDPDITSSLVEQVQRWFSDQGIVLKREAAAEGVP